MKLNDDNQFNSFHTVPVLWHLGLLLWPYMRSLVLLLCLTLCCGNELFSQKRVLQVSGVVVATDSLIPVPYATIYRSKDNRGTFSDYSGYFTMPAEVGDTLFFMYIGLKKSSFVVPDDTTTHHISIVQWMENDEILLPQVDVLPYPTPGKLRQEILALDLPGDQYIRFSRDIAAITNYDGLAEMSDAAYRESSQTIIARYSGSFRSGGNLLDAAAWSKFMKALRRKDDK
jgi:hypothetical protein